MRKGAIVAVSFSLLFLVLWKTQQRVEPAPEVPSGTPVDPPVAPVAPPAPPTPPTVIRGRIVDQDGRPAVGEILRTSVDLSSDDVEKRSDDKGAFAFDGLVAGQAYGIDVGERDGFYAIAGAPEIVVKLPKAASLVARVKGNTDPDTQLTWALEKEVAPSEWREWRRPGSASGGRFGPLAPGTYRVSVNDRVHFAMSPSIVLAPGEERTVDLAFSTRRLDVVVEDVEPSTKAFALIDVPCGERRVFLDRLSSPRTARDVVDRRFTITDAPTEAFQLLVGTPICIPARVPVPAGTGPTTITVPQKHGRLVAVHLHDETGKRISGNVAWRELGSATPASWDEYLQSDEPGILTMPERVEVFASKAASDRAPVRAEVPPGTSMVTLDLTLPPLRKVRVTPKVVRGGETADSAWFNWRVPGMTSDNLDYQTGPPWVTTAPSGELKLRVRAWGFLATSVALPASGDVDVTVALEPAVGFKSQLVDATSRAVRSGAVFITTPGRPEEKLVVQDLGSLGGDVWLPRGDWRVRASAPGFKERTLTVKEGEKFPPLIVLERSP